MFDSFMFKGTELKPGDRISMVARSVPVPCFQATVVGVEDSTLVVFSTQLALFRHNGLFPIDDVVELALDYPAEEAVPMESRADLTYCQRVRVPSVTGDKTFYVMAAFDGVVMAFDDAAPSPDEAYITGGSHFFRAA